MVIRHLVAVAAVAACSFGIWLVSVATLRFLILPDGEPTLAGSIVAAASPNMAVAWLAIAALLMAMMRIRDVHSRKGALSIATPMAIIGMAVSVGYHLERSGLVFAAAAATLMVALIYAVAAALYTTSARQRSLADVGSS